MKRIEIFIDGACRGNPGIGGWACILRYNDNDKYIKGSERDTTNNRMEMMAAIMALKQIKLPCSIEITTDSQYLRKGITEWIHNWQKNEWKTADKKPVKNTDLWHLLLELTKKHQMTWHWVKGHSGHPENEKVDQLANQAIDELLQIERRS
jgi:ribonuclease HI